MSEEEAVGEVTSLTTASASQVRKRKSVEETDPEGDDDAGVSLEEETSGNKRQSISSSAE